MPIWTKICGFTRPSDAMDAALLGVSAIGLNFFQSSKRFVPAEKAREICDAVRDLANSSLAMPELVGVFVNSTADEVAEIVHHARLTAVQFHGDESPRLIFDFQQLMPEIPVIRALRVSCDRINDTLGALDKLSDRVRISAALLDAFVPGEYGGTGTTVSPALLQEYHSSKRPPLILAGGLTPANVSAMISATQSWGVDTASGVESSPGVKDRTLMQSFLNQACLRDNGDSPKKLLRF